MQKQFDVNFFGAIRLVTACLPYLRQKRSGTIAFMNSVYAHTADVFGGAYSASKHAVAGRFYPHLVIAQTDNISVFQIPETRNRAIWYQHDLL